MYKCINIDCIQCRGFVSFLKIKYTNHEIGALLLYDMVGTGGIFLEKDFLTNLQVSAPSLVWKV